MRRRRWAPRGDGRAQADQVVGADRDAVELSARGCPECVHHRRCGGDRRDLAHALGAVGDVGFGLFDNLAHDPGHVEGGRDHVVGERRVHHDPVGEPQLLHDCEAHADRDASFDLALEPERVDSSPDVFDRGELGYADEAELDVHVDDGALGDEGEEGVDVALPALVEGLGLPVVVDARGDDRGVEVVLCAADQATVGVDAAAPERQLRLAKLVVDPSDAVEELAARVRAGGLDGARGHDGLARRRARP